MSLTLSLNNALSGLNINQQSLSVLSQNIANANTKGYTRKIINQTSVYLDGKGAGVSLDDISRKVDSYLLRSLRTQGSIVGKTAVLSDYSERTQLLLGNPGAQNSLSSYVGNFFNSIQSLAQTPENSTLRVNAVTNGASLARNISNMAQQLQDMRLQAENEIVESISVINRNLRDLKALNETITAETVLGKNVGDLLDRRDRAVQDLSQYLDISTFTEGDGKMNIFTGAGISLLDDNLYQLSYNPQSSAAAFIADATFGALKVYRLNDGGEQSGEPVELVSSGKSSSIVSGLVGGKIRALIDQRDRQIPNLIAQLDTLAANFRDEFNQIHNTGIGFPGANSYVGSRAVNAQDFSQWTGKARFAIVDSGGKPITSPYADETSGIRPLTIDFSKLNTGNGVGFPSVQGIIDEFNQYYGPPQNKAVVGNLNNIRLASDSKIIPGSPAEFKFDFDLENISGTNADFFVTNVQVLDDDGIDMTSVTSTIPSVSLASTATYVTTGGSNVVTINTSSAHALAEGQRIYLSTPGADVDGIPASQLGGFYNVTNVTDTSFQIEVATAATSGTSANVASQTLNPRYRGVEPGEYGRSSNQGVFTANLAANTASAYYTIKVNVAVDDGAGNLKTSQVTYRVGNSQSNLLNRRFSAEAVSGSGTLVAPNSNQAIARAIMVDADGNELPEVNGKYTSLENGYLKIVAGNSEHYMAIDSLDSQELGKPNTTPVVPPTNRGFSYFFEMNNFFKSYSVDGNSVTNSAINLAMEDRLVDNPNLISLGKLVQSNRPADPDKPPLYTYERNVGDNSIVQKLSALSSAIVSFAASGGMGSTATTLGSYAGAIVGASSATAFSAESDLKNAQTIMDGFSTRSDSISGVNLDEELANTIIYQNAYTASTRVISVVNDLFETLLNTFN